MSMPDPAIDLDPGGIAVVPGNIAGVDLNDSKSAGVDQNETIDENSGQSLSGDSELSMDHSDSNSDTDTFPLFFPSHSEQHGSRNIIRLSLRAESPISHESRNSVLTEYSVGHQPLWDRLRLPCSTVVRGEAFCDCPSKPLARRYLNCLCGEEEKGIYNFTKRILIKELLSIM